MTYRPRGTLARTLYDKIHNDQYLEGYDMRLVRINRAYILFQVNRSLMKNELNVFFTVVHIIKTVARAISEKISTIGKTG